MGGASASLAFGLKAAPCASLVTRFIRRPTYRAYRFKHLHYRLLVSQTGTHFDTVRPYRLAPDLYYPSHGLRISVSALFLPSDHKHFSMSNQIFLNTLGSPKSEERIRKLATVMGCRRSHLLPTGIQKSVKVVETGGSDYYHYC